ncbi:bifunctional pyr operon transcriptional regulator/uracil phosphoribosyltransferase PyrR [Kocuria rhizophila]|uniref:bifunctional pyr operon transcriptional regulator/uracil phosphoribosyltransferase PyrR n=1 Tax=Kocuria rhizophila TaxID=72000 RepID=UPI000C87BE69|nr:bifunctional pyr operon transcriptional regulator/uracil phosphoribosyltransferase PyrR [Kocuria rhizophila]MDR7373841.1 pyrimidine operon attenuation protein/uracil phosphoribosyltransferase [Kocuria rhizophila]PMR91615.1 bifunctional pyr operon transcriptional regulator/uracil phosphoribosyltransferase PyrR [Kocuria rhizophila]
MSVPEHAESAPEATTSRVILSTSDIDRALSRIAHEILESNRGPEDLVLLGIARRGYPLAQRLAARLEKIDPGFHAATSTGQLDITMYRDDLRRNPARTPQPTLIPDAGIDGRTVVLVDDVLCSGRTIRAALDALVDLGRPTVVRLAVLVDRGHRELPIRADHVGKNLPTSSREKVRVLLRETDPGSRDAGHEDCVVIDAPVASDADVARAPGRTASSPVPGRAGERA